MQPIAIDGQTVRIDVDGPSPLPKIAHWLKDANPPREEIHLLLQGIGIVASAICDTADVVAEGLCYLVTLLVYYCRGYTVAPTKYVSASGRGVGIGTASVSIESSAE